MAILQFKRRAVGGAAGSPSTLKSGEPAWNNADHTLYIGYGDDGAGNATSVEAVGGNGSFVTLGSAQTVTGVKTFSNSPQVPTPSGADNSASVVNSAWVKALNYLTANQTITIAGDATGTGTTSITLTLASTGISAGAIMKPIFDVKGRCVGSSTVTAADIPSLTASKISDFNTAVQTNRLDQLAAPTAAVSLNSQRLSNLADPLNPQDAATKAWVEAQLQGLDPKGSCVVATTGNITLSGTQTIDTVAVVAGDRVLVWKQTTSSENGIYVVAAGAWTRASDADTWVELIAAFTFIEKGTQANSGYVSMTSAGGTLGVTAVTFTQFSGAGQITAGAGLTKTGNTLDAVGTANRITVNADSIDIAGTYVGQTSITTLGTVTTGTWQAGVIAVAYGGLGLSSALTGLVKGTGTAYAAAVAGTDYLAPSSTVDGGTY